MKSTYDELEMLKGGKAKSGGRKKVNKKFEAHGGLCFLEEYTHGKNLLSDQQ